MDIKDSMLLARITKNDTSLEEYESLLSKASKVYRRINNKLKKLKNDDKVKEYLKLQSDLDDVENDYNRTYVNYVYKKCECCKHLYVVSERMYDAYEGRTSYDYGCLKCGIDTHIYDLHATLEDEIYLKYMKDYHLDPYNNTGIILDSYYEFKKLHMLYLEYKEKYKDLYDESIIKMLKEKIDGPTKQIKL